MEITVRESPNSSTRTKPPPKSSVVPVPFEYHSSDDGTDENLLVLLHGLGDTHVPFGKLGQQLHLPQTATLALRAPEQIPFLYEDAFQWYTSFDPLGDLIQHPNPTPAVQLMSKLIAHLVEDCHWPAQNIHFFGFAQGGTVAAEFALHAPPRAFGSVVSISGPLISYPTLATPSSTPVLVFHRPPPAESALPPGALAAFRKGFSTVVDVSMKGEGMPRSKPEFEPIMRFWSEHLGRRQVSELYEVISGSK